MWRDRKPASQAAVTGASSPGPPGCQTAGVAGAVRAPRRHCHNGGASYAESIFFQIRRPYQGQNDQSSYHESWYHVSS